jgi:hypothetical protein
MFDLNEQEHIVVVACPNPPIDAVLVGKAIRVPNEVYDVQILINQLPVGYYPEIVQISARDLKYKPQNLFRFGCTTVMKLGDINHWGNGSLSEMVEYARELQCDYHWSYQSAQQLHFFAEAGLKNVFWMPPTMGMPMPCFEEAQQKKYDVVFRGSLHDVHSRRKSFLDSLVSNGIPIDIGPASYQQCLQDYSRAIISFNCSGNGDLNRRIFEVLLAGGFLLTDRISTYTGLFEMFQEGIHFECYGDENELLEKTRYYLNNPVEARTIAMRGHQRLMQNYSPAIAKKMFHDMVFKGDIDPIFRLGHDKRVLLAVQSYDDLVKRMKFYELIQELQAINPSLSVLVTGAEKLRMLSDLEDLPNINLNESNDGVYDVIFLSHEADISSASKKIKPGGLLVFERGLKMKLFPGFTRIILVDAVTRSTLVRNCFELYQAPGIATIKINKRNFIDLLKPIYRRIKKLIFSMSSYIYPSFR